MNFDKSSKITALFDTIGSILIGGLVVFAWLTVDKPIQFIYTPSENTTTTTGEIIDNDATPSPQTESGNNIMERRAGLEGCVITWCLTLLLILCAWRIISSAILTLALKTKSLNLYQYWMAYKCSALMMSTFILVPAFTATVVLPSAVASFILDLGTGFFIRLLVPEMETISKGSSRKADNKIAI